MQITDAKVNEIMNDKAKQINSETNPKTLSDVIREKALSTDIITSFNNIYNTDRGRRQSLTNLSETKLRENALSTIDSCIKKIKNEEEAPANKRGIFDPSYMVVLLALKDYIFNKGKTGYFTNTSKNFYIPEINSDNYKEIFPETKTGYPLVVPKGLVIPKFEGFIGRYNLYYDNEAYANRGSQLFRLVQNLTDMTFIKRNSKGAEWSSEIPAEAGAEIYYMRRFTPTVYFKPGFTRDIERANVFSGPSLNYTEFSRLPYFTDPKMFLDKILNYRLSFGNAVFNSNDKVFAAAKDIKANVEVKNQVKGGKYTRKHKKSKTQKGGRKNKKTRKH
jgi:hypothetical protein